MRQAVSVSSQDTTPDAPLHASLNLDWPTVAPTYTELMATCAAAGSANADSARAVTAAADFIFISVGCVEAGAKSRPVQSRRSTGRVMNDAKRRLGVSLTQQLPDASGRRKNYAPRITDPN